MAIRTRIERLEQALVSTEPAAVGRDVFAEAETIADMIMGYLKGEIRLEEIPANEREFVQEAADRIGEKQLLLLQYRRGEIALKDLPLDLQFELRQQESRQAVETGKSTL